MVNDLPVQIAPLLSVIFGGAREVVKPETTPPGATQLETVPVSAKVFNVPL